jgi:hypothetical protein
VSCAPDDTCQELRVVTATGAHVEYSHARSYAGELEELLGIAPLIHHAIGIAAIGAHNDIAIVRHRLRCRTADERGKRERREQRASARRYVI